MSERRRVIAEDDAMAIFSASVRSISRGTRRSAVAAAAYRSGTAIHDRRYGKTHDYTRKGGVMESFLVMSADALEALRERSVLWNAAEASETRKNARVARELLLALPHELEETVRAACARSMAEWLVGRYGVAVDVSLHAPDRGGDARNYHVHLLFTTRAVGAGGFGAKTRALDHLTGGPLEVIAIRQAWEEIVNRALEAAGLDVRIDHRSHQALGILLPPQIHEGQAATQMRRRGAKIRESANVIDFRGREVRYTEIDQGGTRAEYNAEIINLQQYRDVMQEQEGLSEETLIEDQIEALQERAGEVMGDIAGLQTAIGSTHLSDSMRGRIRAILDRVMATLFWRHHHDVDLQHERIEVQKKTREMEEKKREHHQLQQKIEELRHRQEESRAVIRANRELNSKAALMPALLKVPIQVKVPLSAAFDAAGYSGGLRKQSTAGLLKAALSPPPLPRRPSLAAVTLRQDVLQVKELLARGKPPGRAGGQGTPVQNKVGMRK